jgi:hypothetical protein
MKSTIKLFGIIALAAIIGLSMTACDDGGGDGGGGGGGSATLGETLTLSGQVYVEKRTETATSYSLSYQNFTGSLTLVDYDGGSGVITNGKLSYSIGEPDYLDTLDIEDYFWGYDDLTTSNPTVKGAMIRHFYTDNEAYPYLSKENQIFSQKGNSYTTTYERVIFVYVEEDVTLSGKGTRDGDTDPEYGFTWIRNTSNFNLRLKAGWNAVYSKGVETYSVTGPISNPTGVTSTSTEAISLNNPALKWVLEVDEYYLPVSLPPASHTALTNGQWRNGEFSNRYGEEHWYSFTVTAGTKYYIWWNDDYEGNDTQTGDIMVSAWYANGTSIFLSEDSGWDDPQEFTPSSNSTVYIKVVPYDEGTYAIAYRNTNTRP